MTQDDTITPFIDLVKQWSDDWHKAKDNDFDLVLYVALQATRWGAAQELDACCQALYRRYDIPSCIPPKVAEEMRDWLRATRRPKPPSLKAQGLKALDSFEGFTGSLEEVDIIRRALESLPD